VLIAGAIAVGGGDFTVVSDLVYAVDSVTIGCAIEIPDTKIKNRVVNIFLDIFVSFLYIFITKTTKK
jgi:hypothetical protein